jgi:NADH-quinone oxidoreductase subunit M
MSGFPILSLMLAIPIIAVAAIACVFVGDKAARWLALGATLVTFVARHVLWAQFDIGGAQWQFTERADLFGRFGWALGIDGIALMLIMLSVFLMPICILAPAGTRSRARRANTWRCSCSWKR